MRGPLELFRLSVKWAESAYLPGLPRGEVEEGSLYPIKKYLGSPAGGKNRPQPEGCPCEHLFQERKA